MKNPTESPDELTGTPAIPYLDRFNMMMLFERAYPLRPGLRLNDPMTVPFMVDRPTSRFPDADRFELLTVAIEAIYGLAGFRPPSVAKEYIGMLVRETMKRGWTCSREKLHELHRLARLSFCNGDSAQALRLMAHAQKLTRDKFGAMDAGLLPLCGFNGLILANSGRFSQACLLFDKAIKVAVSNRISGDPLFWQYFSMATCFALLDMHGAAVDALRRAREVSQLSHISTHVAVGLVNLTLRRLVAPVEPSAVVPATDM